MTDPRKWKTGDEPHDLEARWSHRVMDDDIIISIQGKKMI
jgi:hypothetical protein